MDIIWFHRVCSLNQVRKINLEREGFIMIEADLRAARIGDDEWQVFMAHDPIAVFQSSSEYSESTPTFINWINELATHMGDREYGIKLDFKETRAALLCFEQISSALKVLGVQRPRKIWFNSDIKCLPFILTKVKAS